MILNLIIFFFAFLFNFKLYSSENDLLALKTQLVSALVKDDSEKFQIALNSIPDSDLSKDCISHLLFYAKSQKVMSLLVGRGADVNYKTSTNHLKCESLLFSCASNQKLPTTLIDFLIEHGAELFSAEIYGLRYHAERSSGIECVGCLNKNCLQEYCLKVIDHQLKTNEILALASLITEGRKNTRLAAITYNFLNREEPLQDCTAKSLNAGIDALMDN